MPELFSSVIGNEFTLNTYLICLACALFCGLATAFAAGFKANTTKSFLASLVLLPMIVHTVITMVNGNIGTGLAVMGAFSLVRFRSAAGKARDIAVIFLSMTSGLACASGFVGIAILFTLIVSAVILVLTLVPFGNEKEMELSITVPESLNFTDAFEEVLSKYTQKHRLVRTKTTNMGSLFKLTFAVKLKDNKQMREFINELRCRNGNLEISLCEAPEGSEAL